METPDARQLIETLGLAPLPQEGGWYRETYRSSATCTTPQGERSLATAIYYLLTPDTFSAWHRLPGDELYHVYAGDPVELFTIDRSGSLQRILLGTRVDRDERPQHLVAGGMWQASRLVAGGSAALLGTTMSPGFDFADYEHGEGAELLARYPSHAVLIGELTRS
ncbi:MAG: cupin domain-containing protein [Planctomycetota bacterium]